MVSTSRKTKTMSAQVLMRNDGCQRSIIWVHGLRFKPKLISLRIEEEHLRDFMSPLQLGGEPLVNAANQPIGYKTLSALPQYAGVRFTQGGFYGGVEVQRYQGLLSQVLDTFERQPNIYVGQEPSWENGNFKPLRDGQNSNERHSSRQMRPSKGNAFN